MACGSEPGFDYQPAPGGAAPPPPNPAGGAFDSRAERRRRREHAGVADPSCYRTAS